MVSIETLTWTAVRRDGSSFGEPEAGGFLPVVEAASQGFLDSVVIHDGAGHHVATIALRGAMRPVFGRLWIRTISPDGQNLGRRLRAVLYGFEHPVGDETVRCLCWVLPDGSVVMADRDLDNL